VKIELFPCGLPIILHNDNYSLEEQDTIEDTCKQIQMNHICSDEMFKNCIELYLDKLTEAQIRARELHRISKGHENK
jgi:hypothetical protein